ncbi:putative TGF beta receptor associated protein 1 [Usnea florida]
MLEQERSGHPHRPGDAGRLLTGSYVLRPLVEDIPLSTEGHAADVHITCVELCDENLYIGTSLAEILHFVSIPADPADLSLGPQYIFASRLQPAYTSQSSQTLPGVQQILVLPEVQKACVLCNGTLSFYSLPELSPAFGNATVPNCTWVGGVDLSKTSVAEDNGTIVMICVKNKARLVRIRDKARQVRDIEFPGCLISTRRGNFACVADAHSYALLDVENQQKITLFPISSLDENTAGGRVESISATPDSTAARTSNLSRPVSSEGTSDSKAHGRNTSLGAFVGGLGKRQASPQPTSRDRPDLATPESVTLDTSPSPTPTPNRSASKPENATPTTTSDKPLPIPPERPERSDPLRGLSPARLRPPTELVPHICSPTPTEFLLTTGTDVNEAGVGIFVNLDGDVVRGTLHFTRYPRALVVDGSGVESDYGAVDEDREGFALATMTMFAGDSERSVIEIQRWDVDDGGTKEMIDVPDASLAPTGPDAGNCLAPERIGLRAINAPVVVPFPEVGELLRGKRLSLPAKDSASKESRESGPENLAEDLGVRRTKEEIEFGRRLGSRVGRIILWSGTSVWLVVRNPLATKLDTAIDQVLELSPQEKFYKEVERSRIIQIVNSIRGQEATSETEFLSLEYIRQKASLILFADSIARRDPLSSIQAADLRITEGLLMEGNVDPRVILTLIPALREEVVEGPKGIWVHAGLISVVARFRSAIRSTFEELATPDTLSFVKRYLGAWRQRKGFGSIADEVEVFLTVDAALLRVLLEQDKRDPSRVSRPSPTRIELYALVDSGVDCFDHAIILLEQYKRLFVLSRLYQSRTMARKVLETWRRIIEGERDEGGGLVDGENKVRGYLAMIKDTGLVDEYGTWLARRRPALGVQVFTNESSRVKWEPQQVVILLRRKAPDAVKVYLEHLVFGKKHFRYANDLITYYLDNVLHVLGSSDEARGILSQSYESYRALRPPKPTYQHFISENAAPTSWWHDRLRLLELIGGSHGSDFSYDVGSLLSRIEPFEQDLVPESIILDGRQGRHRQALRLLIHGLGDYHTAVNYCLLGGASIFHPSSGSGATPTPSQKEQAVLFGYLLTEFLRIEDASDRLERTSELLERFGLWYDVRDVLELIPDSWSVELVSGFLVSSFRQLIHERREATVTKALRGAENLQIAAAFVEKCSERGPQIEEVP